MPGGVPGFIGSSLGEYVCYCSYSLATDVVAIGDGVLEDTSIIHNHGLHNGEVKHGKHFLEISTRWFRRPRKSRKRGDRRCKSGRSVSSTHNSRSPLAHAKKHQDRDRSLHRHQHNQRNIRPHTEIWSKVWVERPEATHERDTGARRRPQKRCQR